MPVVGAVIAFGVSEIAGGAIAAAVADIGLTGVAASAATGAITGGISGGVTSTITGGDIGKGILGGVVGGGIGGAATNLAAGQIAAPAANVQGPPMPIGYNTLGPQASLGLSAGLEKGIGSFFGGTAGSLSTGQPLSSALKTGLASGFGSGVGTGVGEALGLGKYGTGALSGALSYGAGKALGAGTSPGQYAITPSQSRDAGASGTQAPSGQAPGASSALGSALFAAPGFGYSPGGPVLGGTSEDKAPKNVWSESDKSLRDVGSTVT